MTASHPEYVIRAARTIDPATGHVLPDACIHVRDGKIAGCASSAPAGLPVIDIGSATLLPGLIDCHTHLLLRPEDQVWPPAITFKTNAYRMAEGVAAARRALEIGFTSARDTGNEGAVFCDTALRQAIDAGVLPGPRLQVATDAISITAGDMALVAEVNPELGLPDPAAMADTRDEMIKQVRRQVKIGADWIKIYCTGTRRHVDPQTMEPLHQMTAEDVGIIVAEARRYRRDVAAHAYGGDGAQAAILGGARTLEHGPLLTGEDGYPRSPVSHRAGSACGEASTQDSGMAASTGSMDGEGMGLPDRVTHAPADQAPTRNVRQRPAGPDKE